MANQPALITITNRSRGQVIADQGELANSFASRGRGLIGRTALAAGYALIIYPEWSIHMMFMKIPLDILFVDKHDQVVGLRERLPPWHPFAGVAPWRGQYVIELPAGVIGTTGTRLGDQLELAPHPATPAK